MSEPSNLLDRLPEPVILLSSTGETLWANRAFLTLARQFRAQPRMVDLFGPPAHVVIGEARRNGSASAFLPLVVGDDPSRGFRVMLTSDAGDKAIVAQFTDLSEEVAWRHQLFRRNSELSVLNDIGAELSSTLDLAVLARRIHEQTGRIMDATNFFIALHDAESKRITFPIFVLYGEPAPADRSRPEGNGLTEYILRTRKPLLLNGEVGAQMDSLGIQRIGTPCVSFLGVPILSDNLAIGVLAIQDFSVPNRYGRHELEIISVIASQASAAIRNARAHQNLQSAYDALTHTQAKLLETERLRGVTETVGTLNHEVNNPLATIAGNAQLLLKHATAMPADSVAKIERILEAAKRIHKVTNRMATLIQATSRPYPGDSSILDLRRSTARDESSPAPEPAREDDASAA